MVAVCVTLILDGLMTFAEVPKTLKAKVQTALETMGLDTNGQPIKSA